MARAGSSCGGGSSVEGLEARRLLSFAPLGPAVDVPQSAGATAMNIAVGGDGTSMVVFVSAGGSLTAIRYAADGTQLGAPLPLGAATTSSLPVSADMDADGDAVVAYHGADHSVKVRLISKAGVVSAPIDVSPLANADEFANSADVSMDDAGGFFVGWTSSIDRAGTDTFVHVRAYDADGTPRADALVPASITGLNSTTHFGNFTIDAHPDGSGAVYAYDHHGDAPGGVSFGRVSASEPVHHEPLRHRAFHELVGPSVAVYDDGSYIVGYSTLSPSASGVPGDTFHGFVQRYSAADEPQGAPILLDESIDKPRTGADNGVYAVDVAPAPDGGFVALFAYAEGQVATPNYVETLYARRFDRAGRSDAAGPVIVQTVPQANTNFQLLGGLAADDHARVLLAHSDGSGGPFQLRRFLAAEDVPVLEGGVLRVFGTGGADGIHVTAVDDANVNVVRNGTTHTFAAAQVDALSISGFAGDDTIVNDTALPSTVLGGAGNDKLLGGSGNDSLSGGNGKDKLLGRDGKDSLSGNAGNDTLEGGLRADRVAGNGGRDRLYGNGGNDRIYGGMQGDWLYGQHGSDQLFGGGGNDRLYDDYPSGVDTLRGNGGNDVLVSRDSLIDHLFGDAGDDLAVADENDVLDGVESPA
jgi:hypothetical protein